MELIHKALDFEIRQAGDPANRTLEFIGSTADVDRYGDIIDVAGWDLKNYQKNPVFLWAHNYGQPPVGKTLTVTKEPAALKFLVQFATAEEYPFADTIYRLYLGGFLKATSVGFSGKVSEPILGDPDEQGFRPRTGTHYKKQELYELSGVPVPALPQALMLAVQKGVVSKEEADQVVPPDPEEKGVIPFKEYPIDDPGATWKGPEEMAACADMMALKTICAWFDDAKPDVKGSYKLPHHRGDGFKVVWKGVSAAMGALLGARGGVNIPDADRKGVYGHLAKHYAQFSKTPPEFKEYGEADLIRITLGAEPNDLGFDDLFLSGLFRSADLEPITEPVQITKAGAVLNAKNKAALQQAAALIQQVLAAAETQASAPGPNKKPESYYSKALNPGDEPHGERQAEDSVDMGEIMELTKNLHLTMCPGK